jgi:hypothetical protein
MLYLEKLPITRWINPLRFPKKTFNEEKEKGSWKKIFEMFLIAGFIRVIADGLQTYMEFQTPELMESLGGLEAIYINSAILYSGLVFLIYILLILPIYSIIIHFFSIRTGGQGKFRDQTYLISLFVAPLMVLNSLLILILHLLLFAGIARPTLHVISVVPAFIFSIYGLYLLILALATVQGFTMKKAVSVLFLPSLILLVIWQRYHFWMTMSYTYILMMFM